MTAAVRTAIASGILAVLAGCARLDGVPAGAVTECDAQIVPAGSATDILFIVDDSGSMREEQTALSENLTAFIEALASAPVRLDLSIGVTNTSIDSGGEGDPLGTYGTDTTYGATSGGEPFPGVAGTPYPAGAMVAIEQDADGAGMPGHFMWDPAAGWGGPRILANGPDLVRDFRANVLQGVWGSSKEQPLEAMRRALDGAGAGGLNSGFRRPGARLAVVVLTDEDDCSSSPGAVTSDSDCHAHPEKLTPLSVYEADLDSITAGDAGPPVFALIAGFDPSGVPSACQGTDPVFVPTTSTSAWAEPNRLEQFRVQLEDAIPNRTLKRSICGSFGPALLDIAAMILPQTLPLEQAPADPGMLAVSLERDGTTIPCRVALAGSSDAATFEAVYTPPQAGALASITFQGNCRLGVRDRVDIRIVCAR